jgi:protein ImuA
MMTPQPHSSALSKLRSKIERLGTTNTERRTLAFGINVIDQALPGGGLAMGAVHAICEQGPMARAPRFRLCLPPAFSRACRGR